MVDILTDASRRSGQLLQRRGAAFQRSRGVLAENPAAVFRGAR